MLKRAILLLVIVPKIWIVAFGQELPESISFNIMNRRIVVDGILEKKEWISVDSIAGFIDPWSSTGRDQTIFKYFCSDTSLYFCFDVIDKTMVTYDFIEELTLAYADRVELYFNGKSDMSQYFCIEMDPLGQILDYSAQYYRKFNVSWDFNNIDIASKFTPQGYVVEGRISLSELERLGIKESFRIGIFRADFRSKKTDDVVWYSWINPKSPTPDFHIPTSLGLCYIRKH
jgi:hypothetical protein